MDRPAVFLCRSSKCFTVRSDRGQSKKLRALTSIHFTDFPNSGEKDFGGAGPTPRHEFRISCCCLSSSVSAMMEEICLLISSIRFCKNFNAQNERGSGVVSLTTGPPDGLETSRSNRESWAIRRYGSDAVRDPTSPLKRTGVANNAESEDIRLAIQIHDFPLPVART